MAKHPRPHIGVYQRPGPPKRPVTSGGPKTVQAPAVPLHEIERRGREVLESMIENAIKPGRPTIFDVPMTAAERQARRRENQRREREIQNAQQITDGHGKAKVEAHSGGWGSAQVEALAAIDHEYCDDAVGVGRHRRVKAGGARPDGDATSGDEDDGAHGIHGVRGLSVGDEASNRIRFAEDELKKIIDQYFTCPEMTAGARWIARHAGNSSAQSHACPVIALTCTGCGDLLETMEDAMDHLRVDHVEVIRAWFKNLRPAREFRDMGEYVTVVRPKAV